MGINKVTEIIAWQHAMTFAVNISYKTRAFPKNEIFGITNQIRRSSLSISSNIAEGFGRKTPREFKRFLNIATGSLFECKSQLCYCLKLKYLTPDEYKILSDQSKKLEALLVALNRSIKI